MKSSTICRSWARQGSEGMMQPSLSERQLVVGWRSYRPVLLGSDLMFSCAHFGSPVFRPTGPRCGSLGRSPAQPDVGLGMLAKQGSHGLKGRANCLARPGGAQGFGVVRTWGFVRLRRPPPQAATARPVGAFRMRSQTRLRPKAALVNRKPAGLRAGKRRAHQNPRLPAVPASCSGI